MADMYRFELYKPQGGPYDSLLDQAFKRSLNELLDISAAFEDQGEVDGTQYLVKTDSSGLMIPKSIMQVPFLIPSNAEQSSFVVSEVANTPQHKMLWDESLESFDQVAAADAFTGILWSRFRGVRFIVSPRDLVVCGRVAHIVSDDPRAPFRRGLLTYGCSAPHTKAPEADSHTRAQLHFFALVIVTPEDGRAAPFKAADGNLAVAQVSMIDLGGSLNGNSLLKMAAKKTAQSFANLRNVLLRALKNSDRDINREWLFKLLQDNLQRQKIALASLEPSSPGAQSSAVAPVSPRAELLPSPPLVDESPLDVAEFDPFASQGLRFTPSRRIWTFCLLFAHHLSMQFAFPTHRSMAYSSRFAPFASESFIPNLGSSPHKSEPHCRRDFNRWSTIQPSKASCSSSSRSGSALNRRSVMAGSAPISLRTC